MLQYIKLILLAILLTCVSVAHYNLHENTQTRESIQVYWSQPVLLDEQFPQLLGHNNWQLNYAHIEEILWQSKFNVSGELVTDSQTAERLHQASILLPVEMATKEWQRLAFLLDKSFSGRVGGQLFRLLKDYFLYQQEYDLSLSTAYYTQENKQRKLIPFTGADKKQLQAQHFGIELAEKLFTQKNITTDYLNARRVVRMDLSLTTTQQQQQLLALEENYKNWLSKQ